LKVTEIIGEGADWFHLAPEYGPVEVAVIMVMNLYIL
jgi:hypothetical protein